MDPASLRYARSHEWVQLSGDVATIGISEFAVKELTDLVYLQLPDVGAAVAAGETLGEVESVKAVSDLYAPLTGEVVEVNAALPENLQWLSEDPFGRGWLLKLKLADPRQAAALMDHAAYTAFCESQAH